MIGIGVIGYGYWGPNLVRNFAEVEGCRVVAVADLQEERLEQVRRRYPGVLATTEVDRLLAHPDVDAVVVATPIGTHFELAMAALRHGCHVLVEKPIADSSERAQQMIVEAQRRQRILLVDHTFVYTGAVSRIVDLVSSGEVGDVHYYDSVRVNLGLFQTDVNVLWDLAVHDLSIIDVVLPEAPVAVSAVAVGHVPGQPENIAYVTLLFPGDRIAHLHVNWLAPVKVRRTLIGGNDRMIVYDDLEPSEKVKVYDRGAVLSQDPESRYRALVSYRHGDMWAPRLDTAEGLRVEAMHFLDCIATGRRPRTDGHAGLRIVKILEAAELSAHSRGRMVDLDLGER